MENQDKKELIKGIAEALQSHEEAYEPGAWENFVVYKKNKRKPGFYWMRGVAAAVAIIIASILLLNRQQAVEKLPVQKLTKKQQLPEETESNGIELAKIVPLEHGTHSPQVWSPEEMIVKPVVKISGDNAETIPVSTQARSSERPASTGPDKSAPSSTSEAFFRRETSRLADAKMQQSRGSRWKFGVEIAPMLSESKVNVGAGVSTEYQLTAKLSISSGISILSLGAEKPVDNQPVSLMSNKKLTAVDANLTAIDIPLAVTYHLNKNLFTSIGVSYLNILSNKRTNSYVTEMELSQMVANPETGIVQAKEMRIVEKKIEPAEQSSLERGSYLGFFNLSVGHEQPINKKDHIVIEPFLKIPVGKLSSDELKFSNGGIKLRYSF